MANDRLRQALYRSDLDIGDLATAVDVDEKTVGRWLGGRLPRPRLRAKVALLLDVPESELWPDAASASRRRDDAREIAGAYAHATNINIPDWVGLMRDAREHIDLLDTTLHPILTASGTIDLLLEKAADGVHVRIFIAHPRSIYMTALAQQLGLDEVDEDGATPLDRQLDQSRHQLERLTGRDGIDLRAFWAEHTSGILRFDDQMIVTLHLYAAADGEAPVLHLFRRGDDGMFDQFADHLDTIHREASEPIEPNPDLYPPG